MLTKQCGSNSGHSKHSIQALQNAAKQKNDGGNQDHKSDGASSPMVGQSLDLTDHMENESTDMHQGVQLLATPQCSRLIMGISPPIN
ncbi:hypothetical protein RSAG8_07225, partial [Rhizoctonia solani AG-8 WAC10335]